jgi:predicted glycogen debranching enzyme
VHQDLYVDRENCRDLTRATRLEWLETNGLGGFASSTITGLNTRRYHGLLTAALRPPVERVVLLSKLEETVLINGRRFDLGCNQYPGVIHPQGYQYLREFRQDPFPVAVYEIDGVVIEKTVFMVQGENTTVVEYALSSGGDCELELRPFLAFRDYHSLTRWNQALNPAVEIEPGLARLAPYDGLPPLCLAHNGTDAYTSGNWFYNFEYTAELERGLDCHEDLFNPLVLRFALGSRQPAVVIASTEPHQAGSAALLKQAEAGRRTDLVARVSLGDSGVGQLAAAAEKFVVRRGNLHTIIAGYHWFTDWGRDTMIALPGIALVTGRPEIAREILEAFASSIDQGMLPNRFPDAGEAPEYNTADATLWMFEAVRSYLNYSGDEAFVRDRLYPRLKDIVDWHVRGTRYGIKAGSDGLLACGEPGVQLTWMDAKVGDWVVTPRSGKPVEIQALWYNAIRVLEELAGRFRDDGSQRFLSGLGGEVRASFNAQFWNPETGCLFDAIDGDRRDGSIRPNQIFAVSLHNMILSLEKAKQVVERVQHHLLTPMGLRTLSPQDPRYRPQYSGGIQDRDSAYHQGTVWPWLMGPFVSAYVKVNEGSAASREQAREWLEAFTAHLRKAGLGQISEIADGDPPHTPRGCIAQAWSVAEILRAAVEDAGMETRAGVGAAPGIAIRG